MVSWPHGPLPVRGPSAPDGEAWQLSGGCITYRRGHTVIVTLQVRESDRKPGSYVLSYLGKTGVNHFRVTAVCGDYYIGGRQFDSLQDLIGYYTHIRWTNNQHNITQPIASIFVGVKQW